MGDFALWRLWTLLSIFCVSLVIRRDVILVQRTLELLQDIHGGCPRQKEFFRSQLSPNGDTPSQSFEDVVRNAGFKTIKYDVETKDGYIIALYRITKKKELFWGASTKRPYPVLLMHGLLSSPFDFVLQDRHKALAYKLLASGFDVFLGANRGTSFSKRHVRFNKSSPRYWAFSHIELGKYDVPALLEKVSEVTGLEKVLYVGYSLGSKQFFSWTSEWPANCSSRVKAMWALAPVAFLENIKSPPLRILSYLIGPIGHGKRLIGEMEFHPSNPRLRKATAALCSLKGLGCPSCQHFLYALGGYGSRQVDINWQSVQMGHVPDSTSNWNLIHQCQEVFYGRFGYLDKGPRDNILSYGVPYPPQLNLGQLETNPNCHVHLIYSRNDWLTSLKDIRKLEKALGGALKSSTLVRDPRFNHYDFIWGINADKYVYDPLIASMISYSSPSSSS